MPRTKRTKSSDSESDRQKSINDWGKESLTGLRLKCNFNNLSESGSKYTLQKRLFDFFNPGQHVETSGSSEQALRAELSELRTLILSMKEPQPINAEQNQNNQIQPIRSQPTLIPTQPATDISMPVPLPNVPIQPAPAYQTITNNSCIPNTAPTFTTASEIIQAPTQLFSQDQTGMNFNSFIAPASTMTPGQQNPYVPPSVDGATLKKAQKMEYIDFDTLLPAPTSVQNTEPSYNLEFDSNNQLTITPKSATNKIVNFANWMCAWNIFTQMILHFRPDLHFALFSYLKTFCNLIRRFKFGNCYMYDKAQRKQIASQINIPEASRTASWQTLNEEIFNAFLRDSDSQLPACYHCHATTHFASTCPHKQNQNFRNGSQNFQPNQPTFTHPGTSTLTNPPAAPTTSPANTRNRTPSTFKQPDNICFRFNNTGVCNKPPCPFRHVCKHCQKPGHTQFQCFNTAGTSFR